MQTKSEMINQIAELAKENAELKQEVKQLHNGRNPEELYTLFGKPIKYWEELKAENDRLKRENGIITGMCNSSSNRFDKLYNCLQEIKAIAEECTTCGDCFNCKYTEHCSTDIEAQALGVCRMILKLITKAEEK